MKHVIGICVMWAGVLYAGVALHIPVHRPTVVREFVLGMGSKSFSSRFKDAKWMFERASRFLYSSVALPLARLSMSDEEANAMETHDDDPSECAIIEEQDEDDTQTRVQMLIARRKHDDQMDEFDEKFEEEGEPHDASAETEPMDGESYNFDSMLENVQKISEDLQIKKVLIEELLARLNGFSNLYRIEALVNSFFMNAPFCQFLQSSFHANCEFPDFSSESQTGRTFSRRF